MAEPCVVVLEDDATIRETLYELLILEGYDPVDVDRPEHVLATAQRSHAALFLIDLMLPEKSGVEVAWELRAHGFAHTPMIAMTSSDLMQQLATDSAVFESVVQKPFDFDALFAEVHALLER
jgi:two-component system KDP operon response regulator KdpE